jgi:hypothetical protein
VPCAWYFSIVDAFCNAMWYILRTRGGVRAQSVEAR